MNWQGKVAARLSMYMKLEIAFVRKCLLTHFQYPNQRTNFDPWVGGGRRRVEAYRWYRYVYKPLS